MSHVEQSDSTSSKRALLVPYTYNIQRQIYLAHAANRTPPHRSGCYRVQSRLAAYSETYQGHAYESNNIGSSSTSSYRHVHPQWMSRAREQEELHIPRAFTQVRQCKEKLAAISSMRPGLARPLQQGRNLHQLISRTRMYFYKHSVHCILLHLLPRHG